MSNDASSVLTNFLARWNVPTRAGGDHHHVRHGWLGVPCPWCGSQRWHRAIRLDVASPYSRCWRCGPGGSLAELLSLLAGRPLRETIALLDSAAPAVGARDAKTQPAGRLQLPGGVGPLLAPHEAYLRRRGLDPTAVARLWGVGGIGLAARLAWRLFVPIAADGQTVSWTTRATSDEAERRWIGARPDEELRAAKSVLYGAEYVRHAAIIVEGPSDVWRVGPGAVALLGLSGRLPASPGQLLALSRVPRRAIVLDAEPAAQRRADALADALAPFPGQTLVIRLDAGDPGAAREREIRQIRRIVLREK